MCGSLRNTIEKNELKPTGGYGNRPPTAAPHFLPRLMRRDPLATKMIPGPDVVEFPTSNGIERIEEMRVGCRLVAVGIYSPSRTGGLRI